MTPGQPSLTARRAAAYRALHQSLDGGAIFADPLAAALLGGDPAALFPDGADSPARRGMRLLIAARSRIAEDALAAAVARGVTQYVVLGAGLDTFAWRNPWPALTVFEVDAPATEAWKRARLEAAGLSADKATFAGVDFETQTLSDGLAAAGFDAAAPAIFAWLGVVPYLTRAAVEGTLAFIAALPGGEVVFDHGEPPSAYPPQLRERVQARADAVARLGEPFLTYFDPPELAALLTALGFDETQDTGPGEMTQRFFGGPRRDGPGGHVVRARRTRG